MSLYVKIKKSFGSFFLDIEFEAGNEKLALLGSSGCGKSMTLKCIAGIETPDEGRIVLDGRVLFDTEKKINLSPQTRCTGLLFQDYAIFPNMTVEQNIKTGIRERKSKSEKQKIASGIMEKCHLNGLEKHYPSQLSGGQKQRTALARILVSQPRIIMLDEPFSALDSFLRWQLEQELSDILAEFKGTALYVSHNRDEVFRLCDRIAVIEQGRVNIISEKWALLKNPQTYPAALLTGCKNISSAEKTAHSTIFAAEWDVEMHGIQAPDDIAFVGIRAKNIHPVSDGEPLSDDYIVFDYTIVSLSEDTFSKILIIRLSQSQKSKPIRWEIGKENYNEAEISMSGRIKIKKSDVLLLRRE